MLLVFYCLSQSLDNLRWNRSVFSSSWCLIDCEVSSALCHHFADCRNYPTQVALRIVCSVMYAFMFP